MGWLYDAGEWWQVLLWETSQECMVREEVSVREDTCLEEGCPGGSKTRPWQMMPAPRANGAPEMGEMELDLRTPRAND